MKRIIVFVFCLLTYFNISLFAFSALTQEVCSVTDDTVRPSPALALRGVALDDKYVLRQGGMEEVRTPFCCHFMK